MNNKKYKHLFELDMLKAYYKLDHIEQIRLQDNYVVSRFKDCSFLNYMKEKNLFCQNRCCVVELPLVPF